MSVLSRNTEEDVLRIIASQYLACLILGFTNAATVQPVIAIERPVFYRERGAGTMPTLLPQIRNNLLATPRS